MWIEKNDFLDESAFSKLVDDLSLIDASKQDNEASTEVEKKKIVYRLESMPTSIQETIAVFGSSKIKKMVGEITGWSGEIFSLIEMPGFGGYAPYHTMKNGGFLGSHVDHSHVEDGSYIHIANCIFYASPEWHEEWGGATLFLGEDGVTEIGRSLPSPNKIVVFTHDSEAFHGVSRIKCPEHITRRSFYMDFYIKKSDLADYQESFLAKAGKPFVHFDYLTVFLPLPKDGDQTVYSAIFKRSFLGYLKNYLFYQKHKARVVQRLSGLRMFWVQIGCAMFNLVDRVRNNVSS